MLRPLTLIVFRFTSRHCLMAQKLVYNLYAVFTPSCRLTELHMLHEFIISSGGQIPRCQFSRVSFVQMGPLLLNQLALHQWVTHIIKVDTISYTR